MLVKIHNSYRDVVAVCDSNLIGKRLEEGKFQLNIKEDFYKGDEKTIDEVKDIIINFQEKDATFNIVGKNSVALAIEAGLISKESVKEIGGVPFVIVLL